MQRKKENNEKRFKKSQFLIVGSLLILIGIGLLCGKYLYNFYLVKKESFKIKEFYKEQKEIAPKDIEPILEKSEMSNVDSSVEYIAVIKIPKIGLEKGLCRKGSYCNNVDVNIQILNGANYPDIVNGNFILASHSGNGLNAYFRNVYKLTKEDEIIIVYDGFEYKYKVANIYDIDKTGFANIIRNNEENTLTLITCRDNTNKQIVVISELIERNDFNV